MIRSAHWTALATRDSVLGLGTRIVQIFGILEMPSHKYAGYDR
jgi:hypothetical protein